MECKCERIAHVGGKCADLCSFNVGENEYVGYVPLGVGIGGGGVK